MAAGVEGAGTQAAAPAAPGAAASASGPPTVSQVCGVGAELLHRLGRDDLAERLRVARVRIERPNAVITIVGEFKQGKSSLANGLVARDVCPVDDDLATSALTVLTANQDIQVVVWRRVEGKPAADPIELADLAAYVTERGNPGNEREVERVEIGLPSKLLSAGITVVDTPGAGSLATGLAAATLGFLPFADALLFVSDASAELSGPELDLLARARERCPTVAVVLSKIDLYPAWRQILELDQGHLAARGIDAPIIPLSSVLRARAVAAGDGPMNAESGYPTLLGYLSEHVLGPRASMASQRGAAELQDVLGQVRAATGTELDALRDPSVAAAAAAQLEDTKSRLERLRGPAARWSVVLNDGISDLANDVTHRFRSAVRDINKSADKALDEAKNRAAWEGVGERVQEQLADTIAAAFEALNDGGRALAAAIVEQIADEGIAVPDLPDVKADLDDVQLEMHSESDANATIGQGLTLVTGISSGSSLLGALQKLLPAAAGSVMLATPMVFGVGLLLGGQKVLEARHRSRAQQRQQARSQLRQHVDVIQAEVLNLLGEGQRSLQRTLRDHFSERMAELQRTAAGALQSLQAEGQRSAAERAARVEALAKALADLDRLLQATTAAAAASTAA